MHQIGENISNGKIIPLLNYHAMKVYGRVEAKYHAFLTSILDGGNWLA
jgi:hypothetical protein